MSNLVADTNKMRNISSEINNLANSYQSLITKLYSRISNMPTTKEWIGGRANDYIRYILLDKEDMMNIGNSLKAYAKTINDDANLIDKRTSEIIKGEEND